MMNDVKINPYQFFVLVTLFSIGSSILLVPSVLAQGANQDAWIAAIVGTLFGLFVVWLFCTIAQWFPDLTFIQINYKLFGKWIGTIFSLWFLLLCFIFTSNLLAHSGTFLNINQMPSTPVVALNLLIGFIVVMGVRLGLETIARSAEILVAVFFILFFILVVAIVPEINLQNVQPVYEAGTQKIVKTSLYFVVNATVNAVVLLMIFPGFINKHKQGKTAFLMGHLIGGLVIIILTFLSVAILGAEKTVREMYPGYELAKRINIGEFVQRIEAFMATLWIISLYFKATLYFYAGVLGLAQILNLKDYRPLTIPFGIICVALSLVVYPNVFYQQNWDRTTSISFSLSIGLFIPLLQIVTYAIRKNQFKKET